jgi:lysophospholipase L1-like esterase
MNASSCNLPEDCTPELYESYVENLESIYAEIFSLREGQATIIRAVDLYNPLISIHRDCGTETVCTRCWETFNAAVHQAADAYQVPVVSIHDLFNGSGHDQDPRAMGYIGPDGEHTTEIGQQAIADVLSQAGYMPLIP